MSIKNLVAIHELKELTFTVSDYQRGYKWSKQEVEDLLNDIYAFKPHGDSFYCLQPIVLNGGNGNYELIDGQQRLTTIFIILKKLGHQHFELKYKTRESSEFFLEGILGLPDLGSSCDKIIDTGWEKYSEENPANDNIDNYHFFKAYQYICRFLSDNDNERFLTGLLYHTKVIWYNILGDDTPESVFINFNKGKIHLEQAELIKALLVLDLKKEFNEELRAYKTNQFAEDWNRIENQLQDDRFWFFVSNDNSDKRKANRIDFLFDLQCHKGGGDKALYSYYHYLAKFDAKQNLADGWDQVNKLFNTLCDWYQDRTLYHLLGFTIYMNIGIQDNLKGIRGLLAYYDQPQIRSKKDFSDGIRKLLRETIRHESEDSQYHTANLGYHSYKESKTVLLLFNIALYELSDFNYRFPFDKLKTQKWSLEHIHAQNAALFTSPREVEEWIEDLVPLLEKLVPEEKALLKQKIDNVTNAIKGYGNGLLSADSKKIIGELHAFADNVMQSHNIANLCLLDGRSNSALNNMRFRDKRAKILDIDMNGFVEQEGEMVKTFIPIGTRNVFLKYYSTDAKSMQFTFWGHKDREEYAKRITDTITRYVQ